MTTILVAGFGPFPGAPKNPSADLVRTLGRRRRPALSAVRIVTAVLPTSYAAIAHDLPALLRRHDPDGVLFFGLAARTPHLRVERRAVNIVTSFYADAARSKLATRRLLPGAPAELAASAPVARLLSAMRATGADARPSRDAGRYVCNAALFAALEAARQTGRPKRVAFVHIPRTRARRRRGARTEPRPRMETLVRAGEAALVALVAELRRG